MAGERSNERSALCPHGKPREPMCAACLVARRRLLDAAREARGWVRDRFKTLTSEVPRRPISLSDRHGREYYDSRRSDPDSPQRADAATERGEGMASVAEIRAQIDGAIQQIEQTMAHLAEIKGRVESDMNGIGRQLNEAIAEEKNALMAVGGFGGEMPVAVSALTSAQEQLEQVQRMVAGSADAVGEMILALAQKKEELETQRGMT